MKRISKKIRIKELKVLGSYGKMFANPELYPHSLRKLTKDVKKCDITAITMAAFLLSRIITPNAVLIPLPQSSGKAEYTLELANTIRIIRQDCKVIDILSGTPREKLYAIKKSKAALSGNEVEIKVKENVDCKETLESNTNIFFVDNVVNTGLTFNCAREALRKYANVEPSLLAISATCNWLN